MTSKVTNFCKKYSMLAASERVLCAVSGGADSMAMLHILLEISKTEGFLLCCAHFNHCIRGEEANSDEEFVRRECLRLGISFVAGRGDVPAYAAKCGLGIEEAARVLRYEFLERTADELGCDKIATGHNASDNAETVLMNLMRGAGLRGVCGIAPVRGKIIRPVLCLDRPEIESYVARRGIEFVTDATNICDDYTRNRVRHNVIEPLRDENPLFSAKVLAACESMREDEDYLASLAREFVSSQGEPVSAAALSALPKPVASRAVMQYAPGATRVHVDAVLSLAAQSGAHGRLSLPGVEVIKQYDELLFGENKLMPLSRRVICAGDTVELGDYLISCHLGTAQNNGLANTRFFCFKTEEICGNIAVSARREGDKLRQKGRGVTKTLKKLFSEARVPPDSRDLIPVLRDEKGVLGVYGFGEDERAAAKSGEPALIVEIKKRLEADSNEK